MFQKCATLRVILNIKYTSVCVRCGKDRIILKEWDETRETRVGEATVSYTKMVCPDVDCQKIVEETFRVELQKKEHMKKIKVQEDAARKRAIARAKSVKA